jgi:hypothetical protein
MGNWFLEDWRAPQRVLIGTLTDVHRSRGFEGTLLGSDNDTNLIIAPDNAHQNLLVNRFGQSNRETYSQQSQIGNNTTASTPFVTPDGWVYFQGTDNTLWKVFNDGSQQSQIGNNTTASTPFVTPDGWVYFQGTDNTLWKVFNDGSQQSQIGNNTTASTPFVTADGWVYFRGTDDTLWKVFNDGSQQSQIGNNTTASTPFVAADRWVYFQGTDNTLWKVLDDPVPVLECEIHVGSDWRNQYGDWVRSLTGGEVTAQGVWVDDDGHESKTELHPMDVIFGSITASKLSGLLQVGGNTTASTPFVTPDGWVYFRGTDDTLWKVFNDGSQQSQIGNNTTASTPFVTPDGWVYFQGTDNTLWKVFNDGSQQSQIGNNTTASTPFVTPDGWVYFQGTDNTLWKVFNDGSQQSQIGNNTTASTPFVTADGWVYFQGTDDTLWKVFKDGSDYDWIVGLAGQLGLAVGDSMLAFRFAVASDNRGGSYREDIPIPGTELEGPPLAQWTRPVTFTVPFPARPKEGVWTPTTGRQLYLIANATIDTAVREDTSGTLLDITVTCLGQDYGGPGICAGEVITYWSEMATG